MFIRLLPQVLRAVIINTNGSPLVSRTVPQPQNPLHHTSYIYTHARTHTHTHTISHLFSGRLYAHTTPVLTRLPCPFFLQSYLASVHKHSGGMMSRALQEAMLPGATESYSIKAAGRM